MTFLPNTFKIQDDELLSGWLEMLADINGFTQKEVLNRYILKHPIKHGRVKKSYVTDLETAYEKFKGFGLPEPETVMRKHSTYFACLPFRRKKTNALMSEYMLRSADQKRLFSGEYAKDEIENFMVCPECMKEDLEHCGRWYIHVWHNLPVVTCCAKHGIRLVIWDADEKEVVPADEKEKKTAEFMYRMYQEPIYGYAEQTSSLLRKTGITQKDELTMVNLVRIVSEQMEYSGFSEQLKGCFDLEKTGPILRKETCKECGNEHYISREAKEMGFGCPVCDSEISLFELAKRFVKQYKNGEYRLIKLLPGGRAEFQHRPCGRKFTKRFADFIRYGDYCEKCKEHIGETAVAHNGLKMTIIDSRGTKDIDVQFEDGVIVKHRTYECFKLGYIQHPDYVRKRGDRLGEVSFNREGKKMTIVRYGNCRDVDVEFEDGAVAKNKTYLTFLEGSITHPESVRCDESRIGETAVSANGWKMTIIVYRSNQDIDVEFEDGEVIKNKSYQAFRQGYIQHPSGRAKISRVGETSISTKGQKMTIIRYGGCNDIDVEFEDGTVVAGKQYGKFKTGKIKNPVLQG